MLKVRGRELCLLDCEGGAAQGWQAPRASFDNVAAALNSLAEVASFEGWLEVLDSATDAVGVGVQPEHMHDIAFAPVLFCAFAMLCGFFALNVFIGLVCHTYLQLKYSSGENRLMTPQQVKCVDRI